MAATIAHEINNPLEAMTNLAYLLTTYESMEATPKHYAQILLQETLRASEVAKQTLAFYRATTDPVAINVGALLDDVLSLSRNRFERKNIGIRREYKSKKEVRGYPSELRQVFTNLILNASDSVPEGGQICIRVTDAAALKGTPERIRVSVFDNGHGIPPNVLHNLFRPFFTTKRSGGNGLGLWVSLGIVEKHGGIIKIKTSVEPGRSGAVFAVLLPAIAQQ